MLPVRTDGESGPWFVLLHWLGGSARSWTQVSRPLARKGYRVACINLPGFGDAAHLEGDSVAAMTAAVAETVRALRVSSNSDDEGRRWLLGGHSMGGKIATAVARLAEDGEPGLGGLAGLVLISPSPPSPEPMPGNKREQLLQTFGALSHDLEKDRAAANSFVTENVGKLPLPPEDLRRAEDDMLQLNRRAFAHWLAEGSREDWSARVGVLSTPALVLAGSEDQALGPQAQRELTLPHLHSSELVTLQGAGHLGPLERPGEVALRLVDFAERMGVRVAGSTDVLDDTFKALLGGPLTSERTRAVMESRLVDARPSAKPRAFDREGFLTLRALVNCVVPEAPFDLAVRMDEQLARGAGDGWRHAELPPDREAWIKGLLSLDHAAEQHYKVPFGALWPEQQKALLGDAGSGDLGAGVAGLLNIGSAANVYSALQMKQWADEVRGELSKLYMSDPRVMQRVGFAGFADEAGFTQIRLGEVEEFEH